MGVPTGNKEYSIEDKDHVLAFGYSWTDEELEGALLNDIAPRFLDTESIDELLASIDTTDFDPIPEFKIDKIHEWQVGEVLAECYLMSCRSLNYSWNNRWDLRTQTAISTGADIVGLKQEGDKWFLAFGEVKSSSDEDTPPNVTYGREGLIQQLENLISDKSIKGSLIKYLHRRIKSTDHEEHFKSAFKKYVKDDKNLRMFGVLVRDVSPNQRDLESRAQSLERQLNEMDTLKIELIAIYLPINSIPTLGDRVLEIQQGETQ